MVPPFKFKELHCLREDWKGYWSRKKSSPRQKRRKVEGAGTGVVEDAGVGQVAAVNDNGAVIELAAVDEILGVDKQAFVVQRGWAGVCQRTSVQQHELIVQRAVVGKIVSIIDDA